MEERTAPTERAERPAPAHAAERPRPRPAAPPKRPKKRRGVAVNDSVADMLTRLRNGARARHETVSMPASKLKLEVAKILKAQGFIAGYEAQGETLALRLKYVGGKIPAVTEVKRISRPGLRVYAGRRELPRVRRGLGMTIVSTSRGLMTGADAAKRGLGGEILCTVW